MCYAKALSIGLKYVQCRQRLDVISRYIDSDQALDLPNSKMHMRDCQIEYGSYDVYELDEPQPEIIADLNN